MDDDDDDDPFSIMLKKVIGKKSFSQGCLCSFWTSALGKCTNPTYVEQTKL